MQKLEHGMLLDAKYIMDNALPEFEKLRELIPARLHDAFDRWKDRFEDSLAQCDVVPQMTISKLQEFYEIRKD